MSLEEFTPEINSAENSWNTAESNKEMSEKFKQQVKKAWDWIKRTKKDEKKAKKADMLLANFLVKIIINKKFDDLLESLFKLIDAGYPSNFLLAILSLIYIEISNKIRETNNLEKIKFSYESKQTKDFDDSNIDSEVKNRINNWVEDIILSISADYSHILTKRLIKLLENKNDEIINFVSSIFIFFLKEININIKQEESINISNFILKQVSKKIKSLDIEKI